MFSKEFEISGRLSGRLVRRLTGCLARATAILWLITVIGGTPLSARAATSKLCVPTAAGVPYWSEAPNWWDSYPDPEKELLAKRYSKDFRRTDDPRWTGALSIDYGAGATDPAEFRALYNASEEALLLSWAVKSMDFITNETSVVVGIKLGSSPPVVVRVKIAASTTVVGTDVTPKSANQGGTTYLAISAFNVSGSNASTPSWALDKTRVWIMPKPSVTSTSKPGFTLQMQIPSGGAPNFKMWYSMQPSVPLNGDPGLLSFTWPKGSTIEWSYYHLPSGAKHIPALDKWGDFTLGQPSSCAGVSIADSDIGVINSQFPGSRDQISITHTNTFYALPKNETTQDLDMSGIKATFYFANWGSQRGQLTGSSWTTLTPNLVDSLVQGPPTGPVITDPDLFLDPLVPAKLGTPSAVPKQKKAQIAPQWFLSKEEKCKFFVEKSNPPRYLAEEPPNGTLNYCSLQPKPTVNPHGCMMVKLNGPLEFLRDSALKNMQFAKASKFERTAEITSAPGDRDVYLFVDRRNMPSSAERENDSMATPTPISTCGELIEIHELLARNIAPRMTYEQLAAVMPTYVVHAFYDAGTKILIDGKPHIALDQQTSFGYWAWHEGTLFGWDDNLSGANNPLDVKGLGHDTYKVSVPNNGAVRIVNVIQAVEHASADNDNWQWWQWLLLILVLILFLFMLWRKRYNHTRG